MNLKTLTYCTNALNATPIDPLVGSTFTGNDPRKGWRIPLNEIKYNEQRDEETGYGYFCARYMDHELMTMWLSVDPMSDKYPSISPYAYCAWNPVKLVDPDGDSVVVKGSQADRLVSQLQTSNMEVSLSDCGKLSVDLHGNAVSELSKEEMKIYKVSCTEIAWQLLRHPT